MNYALLCSYEVKPKQKSSLAIYLFSFLWERKGFLLTKRRPFLSQALSNPTAREMLLHYVQVYLALSRRKFKFDVFKVRVSAAQIYKFEQEK